MLLSGVDSSVAVVDGPDSIIFLCVVVEGDTRERSNGATVSGAVISWIGVVLLSLLVIVSRTDSMVSVEVRDVLVGGIVAGKVITV